MFKSADGLSLGAFLVIVLGVLGASVVGTLKAGPKPQVAKRRALRLSGILIAWLTLLGVVVASGVIEASPMPRLMAFFAVMNLAGVALALSPYGKQLALGLSSSALVAFQAFRLPLELVLHSWASQGVIPETMTWTGRNFDIVSGIVALIAAPFASRSKVIAWAANLVGFALLLNVMRVAMLSSPLPFGWGVTPPLELAFHVPYFLIGAVCVAGALAGHLVLTRKLLAWRASAISHRSGHGR